MKKLLVSALGLLLVGCQAGDETVLLECKIRDTLVPVIVARDTVVFKFLGAEKTYERVPHYKDYAIQEDASLFDETIGRRVFVRGFIFRSSGRLWIHDALGTHNGGKPEVIEGRCSKFVAKV